MKILIKRKNDKNLINVYDSKNLTKELFYYDKNRPNTIKEIEVIDKDYNENELVSLLKIRGELITEFKIKQREINESEVKEAEKIELIEDLVKKYSCLNYKVYFDIDSLLFDKKISLIKKLLSIDDLSDSVLIEKIFNLITIYNDSTFSFFDNVSENIDARKLLEKEILKLKHNLLMYYNLCENSLLMSLSYGLDGYENKSYTFLPFLYFNLLQKLDLIQLAIFRKEVGTIKELSLDKNRGISNAPEILLKISENNVKNFPKSMIEADELKKAHAACSSSSSSSCSASSSCNSVH